MRREGGRGLPGPGRDRRGASAPGPLRAGLEAGGLPGRRADDGGPGRHLLQARHRCTARLGPAAGAVGRGGRRRPAAGDGRHQHARVVGGRPRAADAAPDGDPAADGDDDEAQRGRRAPLGPDALPDAGIRRRGRHVACRVRGLLLPRVPVRPARPGRGLEGAVRRDPAARRLDQREGGDPGSRGRGPTSRSTSPVARSWPRTAVTTCPTASSSRGPSRTRSTAR